MQGSEETTGQSPDELRAQQERDLAVGYALATMEFALAEEAFHVGTTMRESVAGSMLSSTLTTRPFESAISISPHRRRPTGAGRRCGAFCEE